MLGNKRIPYRFPGSTTIEVGDMLVTCRSAFTGTCTWCRRRLGASGKKYVHPLICCDWSRTRASTYLRVSASVTACAMRRVSDDLNLRQIPPNGLRTVKVPCLT